MKLFISHPSDRHDLCERLRLALEAEGHEASRKRRPDLAPRDRLWRYLIDGSLLSTQERTDVPRRVSPAESLATFDWLFPVARQQLELLQKQFVAAKEDSRLSRAVRQALADLGKAG